MSDTSANTASPNSPEVTYPQETRKSPPTPRQLREVTTVKGTKCPLQEVSVKRDIVYTNSEEAAQRLVELYRGHPFHTVTALPPQVIEDQTLYPVHVVTYEID